MNRPPPNDKNGQVATEFLLYTAVFMLLVIISYVVVNQVQATEIPLQQNTVAKETGAGFQNAITLAIKGGRGFSYNYTFPRTIFSNRYSMDFNNANAANASIIITWQGSYGNFSYAYDVPFYHYKFQPAPLFPQTSDCLNEVNRLLSSEKCADTLRFINDGENLTIMQGDH